MGETGGSDPICDGRGLERTPAQHSPQISGGVPGRECKATQTMVVARLVADLFLIHACESDNGLAVFHFDQSHID
jgi:hypothetical protein